MGYPFCRLIVYERDEAKRDRWQTPHPFDAYNMFYRDNLEYSRLEPLRERILVAVYPCRRLKILELRDS